MEFTSVEFHIICGALREQIRHLRKQVSFAEEQLIKNQNNEELLILIKNTLAREKQELEKTEAIMNKFLTYIPNVD